MNKFYVIKSLCYRAWLGTHTNKGRIVEILLFPVSQLAIWGLFLYADLVEQSVAEQLFLINLVWAFATAIQTQANIVMMSDFWSGEFPELFRSGIDEKSYIVSILLSGLAFGMVTMIASMFLSWWVFDISLEVMLPLIYSLPCYLMFSLALAVFAAAIIIRLNHSYGFIAFSILTFIVMLSSPYTPVENLPAALRGIALFSPIGLVFEFIRNGDTSLLYKSFVISIVIFILSSIYYFSVFKRLRKKGDFFNL